ncbi:MAG: glycosyltransferase [Oscillospiraceae bacterium]|nr:glycosyltransferase [Oscillospiraceae bacterium]
MSVIVPVWGTEKQLRRCMDSLLAQTLRELEIVAVDDGSPDACPRILDEYAENNPEKVRVFHIENGGLANARNYGIAQAHGEYLGFADSDDWAEQDMFAALYDRAEETGAEVCVCGYYSVRESDGKARICHCGGLAEGNARENPAVLYGATSYVWNKLIRRDFLTRILPLAPVGLYFEDIPVSYCALFSAGMVTAVCRPLYHYLRRTDSITGSLTARHSEVFDALAGVNAFCRGFGTSPQLEDALLTLNRKHLWLRCMETLRPGKRAIKREILSRGFAHMDSQFPGWRKSKAAIIPAKARFLRPLLNRKWFWRLFA